MINKKVAKRNDFTLSLDQGEDDVLIGEDQYLRNLFDVSPEKGLDLLFRKYYSNLCSHCIRFVHSKVVAEDIVSEIFANLWQKRHYENIEISYRAYLFKCVRFRSYNYLKSEFLLETQEIGMDSSFEPKSEVDKPDEILHYHELSSKLDRIIKSLPGQSRKAFQLSRLEGKKYKEIASDLNITVSAVERLIGRALTKIRTELKSELIIGILLIMS